MGQEYSQAQNLLGQGLDPSHGWLIYVVFPPPPLRADCQTAKVAGTQGQL